MYILFAGQSYYARGGGNDFCGKFDYLLDAILVAQQYVNEGMIGPACDDWEGFDNRDVYWNHNIPSADSFEWWHVFDCETGKIVVGSGEQAYGNG